jgi:hypothetical protein
VESLEVLKRYDGEKNGWRVVDVKELGVGVWDWRGEVDEEKERVKIQGVLKEGKKRRQKEEESKEKKK